VDHTKFKYKLCATAQMKDLRFYLDQTKEKLSLKIDITTHDNSVPEKHYKLHHESDQELQQWYVNLLDTFNVAPNPDWEFFETLQDIQKCYAKRKQVIEKYIETEVPFVHNLQGLYSIIALDVAEEDDDSPREEKADSSRTKRDDFKKEAVTSRKIIKEMLDVASREKDNQKDKETPKERDKEKDRDSKLENRSKLFKKKSVKKESAALTRNKIEELKNSKLDKLEKPEITQEEPQSLTKTLTEKSNPLRILSFSKIEDDEEKKTVKHRKPIKHATVSSKTERPEKVTLKPQYSPRSIPSHKYREDTGMNVQIKPIFDALKPIIERHIEMKLVLFEKVSKFPENPTLCELFPLLTTLFDLYEHYCSVWESRKGALKEALVPSLSKRKPSELISLTQQFEEIHMVHLEHILAEVSTRPIHISSMLTECKQYTQESEPDFSDLQRLSENYEKINEKIVARAKKDPVKEQAMKKANRVSRGVDRAKQMIKPSDKKL